jgi:20S proteasome alpha/beta subunit
MTVIAWDGKTLAADRQSTDVGLRRSVTKISRAGDGSLMGAAGQSHICRALRAWYDAGARPEDFPDKDKTSHLLVISTKGEMRVYDGHPVPAVFEVERMAIGSGRDYAEAAMFLGKTAREAVEVACHFDNGCGNGIDTLELE